MGGRGKGRSQVNMPSAWSVQFAHPLPHPFPFLSVREEDNHCRAEPLQAEIMDQQALSQQVSSYPSSQGRVVTTSYFTHFWQLSQVLLRDTIFSCSWLLQGQHWAKYSGDKTWGGKPHSQWCKCLGEPPPPSLVACSVVLNTEAHLNSTDKHCLNAGLGEIQLCILSLRLA